MRIEEIHRGFIEYLDHPHVEKVICTYDGQCTVCYHSTPPKTLHIEEALYNCESGIPISDDGKLLFECSWENGLTAYDIETNEVAWRFKRTRIKDAIAYPSYVITARYGKAVLKFHDKTGEMIGEINSGTIETIWELRSPYILVKIIRGKLSVVNTETMTVVKAYKENTINPNHCLSLLIQGCQLKDNALWIYGIERYANYDDTAENPTPYARVIDDDFLAGL